MAKSTVIVLAGGSGSRMGAEGNKVYLRVNDRPLLSLSLGVLNRAECIDEIVVVVREGEHERAAEAVQLALANKTVAIVTGGATRQASEWAGLNAIRQSIVRGDVDVVALHDGARPFITEALIAAVIEQARLIGGAVPGLPVDEPLFRTDASGAHRVSDPMVRMQTPQAFRAAPLLAAHDRARQSGDTSAADTAETVERFGTIDVALVDGDPDNIKVTFASDLELAASLERTKRNWFDIER